MKHVSRPTCAAGLLSMVALLANVPAVADAPVTDGPVCSVATVVDPTAEEGTSSGVLEGGPTLFTQDRTTPQQGTLVCRVQVIDAPTSDHNGSGPTVSGHTNAAGVAVAGPQVITINVTGTQNAFLCAEFVDDASGVTYYWDDDSSEWSTSPYVHCGLWATGIDSGNPHDTYPTARITLRGTGLGQMTTEYDWVAFDPVRIEWTCDEYYRWVTCSPPPPSHGPDRAVCGSIEVSATNYSGGELLGSTRCADGGWVDAWSYGPTLNASSSSASPQSTFGWTCYADDWWTFAPGLWEVTCSVNL